MYLTKARYREYALFLLKEWQKAALAGDQIKCNEIEQKLMHALPAEVRSFQFGEDAQKHTRQFALEETSLDFTSWQKLYNFIERTKPEDFRLP